MMARAEARSTASFLNPVAKVLLGQLASSVVLALLFWGFGGRVYGYSALLGGLTCVIPNSALLGGLTCVIPNGTATRRATP